MALGALTLNHFWTCLLVVLPGVMRVDVAGVVEAGPGYHQRDET